MSANERRLVMRRALEACTLGEVESLPDLFTEDVNGWSPNLLVTSREELAEVVADREDAISDVDLEINALDVFGNKGFAEYRLSGTFSGPFALSEDTVVEPNGHELLLGAAMVAEFKGTRSRRSGTASTTPR